MIFLKARHHLALFNAPSQAQAAAGNYPKLKLRIGGMDISIENPRGSIRSGRDAGGREWASSMAHHYGYIRGTLGVDGDHFDVFVGPNSGAPLVWVVTTMAPPAFRKVDEQKAMLGFNSEEEARQAFVSAYDDPRFLGSIKEMPVAEFKEKVMVTRDNPRLLKGVVLFFKADDGDGKLGASTRERLGRVGSRTRADEPEGVFLDPAGRKYPVKMKQAGKWEYSPDLLLAAVRDARMNGREAIASRADAIRARLSRQ